MQMELYHNATQNAVLLDLSDRVYLDVKGPDSKKFLNGILTNNIQALKGATGCYSCLCTPKGKMIADLYCYTCGDYFGIDCSAALKPIILETLKKYIIFQKVELVDQSEKWGAVGVIGPKAVDFIKSKRIKIPEKEFEYCEATFDGLSMWVIRKKIWGLDGLELWCHREQLEKLKKSLNLPALNKETQEILRIESATPLFGVDMDQNTIPQEAGLYNALNFNKGCYVGQEIIARLEHRGHVGKKLVQIKIDSEKPPAAGEKILSPDGQEIGHITSSCFSPKFGSALALGYIRHAFLIQTDAKVADKVATIIK